MELSLYVLQLQRVRRLMEKRQMNTLKNLREESQAAWSQQSGSPILESGSGHVGHGQEADAGAPPSPRGLMW